MKRYFLISSILFQFGCATLTPQIAPIQQVPPTSEKPKVGKEKIHLVEDTENVDVSGVKRVLGINLNRENLGYTERVFDTCEVGNGYSKVKNCRKKFFVLIQFQLQCRDSEGTTSEIVTSDNLTSMSNRDIVWSMKLEKGESRTDSQGYAQLQLIAPISQKGQRVRIGNKSDFLYLKSDEINQVILPKYWCN